MIPACCDLYRHLVGDPMAACAFHDAIREDENGFNEAEIDITDQLLNALLDAMGPTP
jgi:hypothetical protein